MSPRVTASVVRGGWGWAPLVLLGLLVAAVHARGLGSDFVYDGRSQIAEDDYIHQPGHLVDVLTFRVLGQDILDGNRPTQLLSLMLDALVWGRRPFGFHLTNLLLHLACVLLLHAQLRRCQVPPVPAGLAAGLFAVHPLVVEVVAEPSYREDLLVGLLMLGAVRLFQDWRAGQGRRRGADGARLAGVVGCALGAVGAKESGVAVVLVLAAVAAMGEGQGKTGRGTRQSWGVVGVVALVLIGFLVLRFGLQPEQSVVFPVRAARLGGSLGATLLIQLRIFALYAGHIVWPVRLSADYTPAAIAALPWGVGLLVALAVIVLQAGLVWRAPLRGLALLGTVGFWATLLPASNLMPMYRPAADRYLYVPLMGLAALLAVGLAWLWPRKGAAAPVVIALSGALFACALGSIARQGVFASDLALWQDTLRVSPDSPTALNNHAWALLDARRLPEAQAGFVQAVTATRKRDPDPLAGLAIAAFELGQRAQARTAIAAAIELDATYANPDLLRRALRLTHSQLARLRPLLPP